MTKNDNVIVQMKEMQNKLKVTQHFTYTVYSRKWENCSLKEKKIYIKIMS